MKPILYLMVGYPGAGKTTVAQIIHERTRAVHIWTDYERKQMFGDKYNRDDSKVLYDALNKRVVELLRSGKSVIYDTNFSYAADRNALKKMASDVGADTKIVWLTTSKEVAKVRVIRANTNDINRVFAMSDDDFDYVAGHFQPPTEEEKPIKIDGVAKLDTKAIVGQLGINLIY
jgi:predicted kinase